MDVATETPVVETPVVEAPPVEGASETPSDPSSIAELAAATFPSEKTDDDGAESTPDRSRAWSGRFIKGQTPRAQSHQAGPKDVDDIKAQTARLRKAESEAGITAPERKQGESDRAYNLRRQADIAEALRDARKAPQNGSGTRQEQAPVAASAARKAPEFDKPRPKAIDFGNADDPAEAYIEALADWRFDKRLFDAQQVIVARQSEESQRSAVAEGEKAAATLNGKIDKYLQEKPDYWQRMDGVDDIEIPDIALHVISSDDNAPQIAYHLATHPKELLALVAFAGSLDLSAGAVSKMKRYLREYLGQDIGASTGPPPPVPAPIVVAPRPPRSVGTGSMKTGEEPPAEPTSIAEFARFFGPKARR